MLEAKAKDIGASVLKRKKRSSKFFQAICKKQGLQFFFSGDQQNFNNSKNTAVLEPRTAIFENLRLRGQGHQKYVLEYSTSGY